MLPKVLYIYEETDGKAGTYFVANTAIGDLDEGLVGVYDLRECLQVRHALELRRKGTRQWFKSPRP